MKSYFKVVLLIFLKMILLLLTSTENKVHQKHTHFSHAQSALLTLYCGGLLLLSVKCVPALSIARKSAHYRHLFPVD